MIELVRIVKPVIVVDHGQATIETRVETLVLRLTDCDGREVSLAFDGRCDSTHDGGGMVRETYREFVDCPVLPVGDGCTLRQFRDALNRLYLD